MVQFAYPTLQYEAHALHSAACYCKHTRPTLWLWIVVQFWRLFLGWVLSVVKDRERGCNIILRSTLPIESNHNIFPRIMEPILGFNRSARVAFSFKIKFLIPPPPISIIIFVTYGKIAWVAACNGSGGCWGQRWSGSGVGASSLEEQVTTERSIGWQSWASRRRALSMQARRRKWLDPGWQSRGLEDQGW